MDISVVIPLYNEEESIPELYAWIRRVMQEHQFTYEVIFVNDGSTDESPPMVDRYANAHPGRVRALHRENGGLVRAWSDGVQIARGDYLCFVDSDDWIDAEMLEELATLLKRDGMSGALLPGQIVCCGYRIEYPRRPPRPVSHSLPEGIYEGETLLTDLKREVLGHETRRVILSRCMKLFSRELILRNLRLLDLSIRLGEDVTITVPALLDADRVVLTNACHYHYLFQTDSMAHRYDAGFYDDCLRLRGCLTRIVREKGMPSEEKVRQEFLFLFLQTIKVEIRRRDGRLLSGQADHSRQPPDRVCVRTAIRPSRHSGPADLPGL